MKDVLVAIDGSKHSDTVLDSAIELAKRFSSKIVLVHVTQDVPVPDEYKHFAKVEALDFSDYYADVAKGILDRAGTRIRAQQLDYEESWGVGNPTDFILRTAKTRDVGLIVIGVHGLHRLARIRALGSTARRVIENSTVPVVSVP